MNLEFKTLDIRQMGKEEVNSILASELHKLLGIKKGFTSWMRTQIEINVFEEDFDYIMVWNHSVSKKYRSILDGLPDKAKTKKAAFEKGWKIDYILTLDAVYEIIMMSQTEKGKEARRYFIHVEKVAKMNIKDEKFKFEINKIKEKEELLKEDIIDKRIAITGKLQELMTMILVQSK